MTVDLREFAQMLSESGTEAHEVFVPVPGKGLQHALLVVGLGFFPSWELDDRENAVLVGDCDFVAIKAKRPANWEIVEPRLWEKFVRGEGM